MGNEGKGCSPSEINRGGSAPPLKKIKKGCSQPPRKRRGGEGRSPCIIEREEVLPLPKGKGRDAPQKN